MAALRRPGGGWQRWSQAVDFMTMKRKHWSVAEAKASLSALIHDADAAPQTIANRGRPVAVVLSFQAYEAAVGAAVAKTVEASRWQGFLSKCEALRARGGASLKAPKREVRRSPIRP